MAVPTREEYLSTYDALQAKGMEAHRDLQTACRMFADGQTGLFDLKPLFDAALDVSRKLGELERRMDRAEQRGAVSLPLLTFQACAAIGLASALWSVYLRLSAQLGGFGL